MSENCRQRVDPLIRRFHRQRFVLPGGRCGADQHVVGTPLKAIPDFDYFTRDTAIPKIGEQRVQMRVERPGSGVDQWEDP